MNNENNIYCFTFGSNHTHPLGGYSMGNFWIEIHGTYDEARQKMFDVYGAKWSMQYLQEDFDDSFFSKGCHEVIK